MIRSFKYRLWTNANQERELETALETHRRLYNECLDWRNLAWDTLGASISYFDQSRWFSRKQANHPYYSRLNAHSAEVTMKRLDRAFESFFRRCKNGETPGYPRFKSNDRFNSFCFRDGTKLIDNRLRLHRIGTIRVNLHRPIEGQIKAVTIKRECGKWYAIFACELPDVPLANDGKPAVGIDMGLESFLTTSDGEQEPNPRYLKTELPELRRLQRSLARKKKGSSNRRKSRQKLAKQHARIRNLRREHHHQTALKLVRRYGIIAVESLNVNGMLRNGRLSRAISDAGWSGFLLTLRYKAASAGIAFVEVDPRGTSQQCVCGAEVRKELSVRWHDCPHCSLSLHRDHVAAKIILARGLDRTGPAGLNVGHKAMRVRKSQGSKAKV